MNELIERVRQGFEHLNEREQRLVVALGVVFAVFLLGLPLVLMYNGNQQLEEHNEKLQALIDRITIKAPQYAQLAEAQASAARLYQNKTPPLGSFVEAEAKKQGLTVREVNDQPEKSSGGYLRRSVNVSLPGVALTPTLNLMSSMVASPFPVAIEQVQIEHYQSGDKFNVKLGVLTFDKERRSSRRRAGERED